MFYTDIPGIDLGEYFDKTTILGQVLEFLIYTAIAAIVTTIVLAIYNHFVKKKLREKKNIQLDSAEGIQKRMDLYAFTQELQKLDASYKKGAIDINQFADNIISCKDRLIHVIH